jgi:hypothetical protein
MATRQNFSDAQRQSAFTCNSLWLKEHTVSGIEILPQFEGFRQAGLVIYCENCLFCHTDRQYFDVDHLVPDQKFRIWGKHPEARVPENMMILCKSVKEGDLGCNQCKGSGERVPRHRGLAFTNSSIDMNSVPVHDRPFIWT